MACGVCGKVFRNRYQLGPHKRRCIRRCIRTENLAQGRISSSGESDIDVVICTPVEVVHRRPEEVCLRACVNRVRDWHASTPALFATRPPITPDSMARDYRPVSCLLLCFYGTRLLPRKLFIVMLIFILLAHLFIVCMYDCCLFVAYLYFARSFIYCSCKKGGKSMSSALMTRVLPRFGASLMPFEAKL